MNKLEAYAAMRAGKKVTHSSFSPEEWMTIEDNRILLEDGVRCGYSEFWDYRTGEVWNDGYSIFEEKKSNN